MKYKVGFYSFLAVLTILSMSCGGKNNGISSTTGWNYNDPKNGNFKVKEGVEQETGPGLVFIEGGTFSMGGQEQDVTHDWNNIQRRVTVSSFYMDETEVKNIDYLEYLWWISRVYASYPDVYKKALPDTLVWRSELAYNEPYVETYLRHPAYKDYPVVGVNWLQANDYCQWRTDRVNEQRLIREGYLKINPEQKAEDNFNTEAYLAGQYVGAVNQSKKSAKSGEATPTAKLEDGILLPKYRLPTEAEWEYAALGLVGNAYNERLYESKIYPWNGHNMRNGNKKEMGQMRANYVRGRGDMMGSAGALNDKGDITVAVNSYWPNDYGLYCMAGNVNEWVLDVYRPLSYEEMDEFRPFRGNEFKTLVRNEDGTVAQKDSLGHLKYRAVTDAEANQKWRRYTKSDYRNYKDGDYASSIEYTNADGDKKEGTSQRMYDNKSTTLINDNVRVYKGGSWRDRAYWLDPRTRRFLQDDQSKDDLGFRCAMTRVGSPTLLNAKAAKKK
ncbi:MAG: SUMF1/EgtB/PvdO family nonheme iron enzyme [Bacteroidota bacterium]|nr:SUMF1/EgtB/PvdO family nonheme iron enzyme [Bacteroidota bacterium]